MLATFKETLVSIQDKTYGRIIITKPIRSVLWYWTKYILIFTLLPVLMLIAVFTYTVPQLPRLFNDHMPDVEFGVNNEQFFSTHPDPVMLGSQEFLLIIDPNGSPSRLDNAFSGIMVLKDQILLKNSQGQTDSLPFSDVSDFRISKANIIDWTSRHQSFLWAVLVLALIAIAIIAFSLYWSFNIFSFVLWSALFWFSVKIIKRHIPFKHIFRLVIYASVPSLLLSVILSFAPNRYLSYLNILLFVFFTLSWLWNLDHFSQAPVTAKESPSKVSSKKHKSKK